MLWSKINRPHSGNIENLSFYLARLIFHVSRGTEVEKCLPLHRIQLDFVWLQRLFYGVPETTV